MNKQTWRKSLASRLWILLALGACGRSAEQPQLLIGGPGDQRSPAWLPGGKAIVFSSAREGFPADLFLFDLEAKTSRPITRDVSGENYPAVSPDGRFVLFHTDREGQGDIYRLDLKTGQEARLTTNTAHDGFAAWSPDGAKIVFVSEGAGDPDLWIMDRDGNDKTPLLLRPGEDSTPAWSPDGAMIAFSSEAGGTPDIWLIAVRDRRLTQLTHSPDSEFRPVWSPDGRRIVYCRGPIEGHARIWMMNADGSNQRPLSTGEGEWDDFDPAFSPDGKRLALESNRNGDFDIWMIHAK